MAKEKVLIVGAGDAGKELLDELKKEKISSQYEIMCFVDDDLNKKGIQISGISVVDVVDNISEVIKIYHIDTVFIAIPSGNGLLIRKIISKCHNSQVKIKIIPRISEIINGLVDLERVRDIQPEDLLGRGVVKHDFSEARRKAEGKKIMVFGAAGSIGSKLCEQIASINPAELIAVDFWENGLFHLEQKLNNIRYPGVKIKYIIGDVRDKNKISRILAENKPHVIFNAAAYKHVPLMELNPDEAVKNNILSTKNLFELSAKYGVENFILISSDKAVNPTNVMGATKRVTEKLMHYYSKRLNCKFLAVRFGNVLNSEGSVIPTFKKQIEEGVITVTHKDVVRYFMTIDEAVQLVIQCWVLGKGDEIFVLDMGEPVKIIDLAKLMIRLSGKEVDKDVQIRFIGLRPGEKLYEEPLTTLEEMRATKNQKIYILNKDEEFEQDIFMEKVNQLIDLCNCQNIDPAEIKVKLKEIVPTYMEQNYNASKVLL